MTATSCKSVSVSYHDLLFAFESANSSAPGENQSYVCKNTGRFYFVSVHLDDDDDVPEDIETSDQYLSLPSRRELDLGRELVFSFVLEYLPDEWENIRDIFHRKGAYSRFRDMLSRRGMLDKWHAFEASAVEKALREWAEDNGIQFGDAAKSPPLDRPAVCTVLRAGAPFIGKQGFSYAPAVSAETVGAAAIHMQLLTIPPGGRAKAHKHEAHETAIYVLSGEGGMYYGERLEHHLVSGPGDFVYIPANVPHLPYNRSQTEPCLAVISRTDPNEQESVVLLPELDAIHA